MTPATTKFRGIVSLNRLLMEDLTDFLREREGFLAEEISHCFEGILQPLPVSSSSLANVLNGLKAANYVPSETASLSHLQSSLNMSLWSFVEVLEGAVTELFEQLQASGLESWDDNLAQVVADLVNLFQNHLQGLIHAIHRLDDLLWKCRDYMQIGKEQASWIMQLLRCGRCLLDHQLLRNLDRTLAFLNQSYSSWHNRYLTYLNFNARAMEATHHLSDHLLFQSLSEQSQETYQFVLRMVRLWEIDAGAKAILLEDVMHAVRDKVSSDSVYGVYREYYLKLKIALFATSNDIKVGGDTLPLADIGLEIANLRTEVSSLQRSIARYREFLLRTDPNPYVRSRWGFPEWIVGAEPQSCKQLLQLEYQVEAIDRLYASFSQALIGKHGEDGAGLIAVVQEIQRSLHALGQPLLSRHVMMSEGARLMERVDRFDELSSTHPRAVDFVAEVLIKALRHDSKFSLLFHNSLFHKVYAIHHELASSLLSDQTHRQEIDSCKLNISKIIKWIEKGHAEKHVGDMEQLHEQISRYLNVRYDALHKKTDQNFVNVTRQQLLEFCHLLGDFYHRLGDANIEGRHLRQRFASIDHRLEALESAIQSLDPDAIRLM